MSKSLDWSYEFRENMPPTVIAHLSEIFPLLTEINLAGNDIASENFPPLHLFSKLRMINISHNALTKAPWGHLDTLVELDALDAEHNRLTDRSMTMRNGPNSDGLTCRMLERLRTMSSFSVAHNFVITAQFQACKDKFCTHGGDKDPTRLNTRLYFQQCPQGSHAVMKGAVAAAKFLLSHVKFFAWRMRYCSDTFANEGKDYKCLSAGSKLSVANILSIAAPEKLGILDLKYLPIGPFPGAKVTSTFKHLVRLAFQMDLSGSSSVSLLEGMYTFPSLDILQVNGHWSNENGEYFCVDRNATCTTTRLDRLPALSPSIQNLKNLFDIRIGHIQGGTLPIELFELPKLKELQLDSMSFAPLLFETIVEYVGHSKSLKSLTFGESVRWPSAVRPLPNFGEIWKNTPIQHLRLAGVNLTFQESPVSVAPFLDLPNLTSLDVCNAYTTSFAAGRPSFALVPFNSLLNRNLTTYIGNCASGACSWSTQSVCN
jgi:Leucine-rich repeat (LRR) protein